CGNCQLRALAATGTSGWAIGWALVGDQLRRDLLFTRDPEGRWWPASRSALPLNVQQTLNDSDRQATFLTLDPIRFVPPWYLASLMLSLVLSLPALLRPPEKQVAEEETQHVENVLVSDRPLEPTDYDALGLKT